MELARMASRKRNDSETDETPEAKRAARLEFQRQRAQEARLLAEARSEVFTHLRLWTVCPEKRCLRARACAGDAERCVRERWHPLVPREIKALLLKTFALMEDGYSHAEAARSAREEMRRHREAAARLDALDAQDAPAPAAPAAPAPVPAPPRSSAPQHGPRIRFL